MKKKSILSLLLSFYFKILGVFLVLLFIGSGQLKAQEKSEAYSCGTQADPKAYTTDFFYGDNQKLVDLLIDHNVDIDKDYLNQLEGGKDISSLGREMFKSESAHYDIPIKAWVYRNNNGVGNFNENEIYQIIDKLNELYQSYNINFYLLCDISFINNTNYANYGDNYFEDFTLDNKEEKVLNVHFIIHSGTDWSGKANFPLLPFVTNGINPRAFSCAVTFNSINTTAKILGHEIGHTLNLFHTHHPGRRGHKYNFNYECGDCYQESVSRSKKQGALCVNTIGKRKCEVNGDFLCDTEADPYLRYGLGMEFPCNYTGGGVDNWNASWAPNTNNIMSYSFTHCLNYFSPLQVAKMYGYIPLIGIDHTSLDISGSSALCSGQIETYSVNTMPGATSYFWELSSNYQLLSGQGTNTITIQAMNDFGGTISVTPNCGTRKIKKTITSLGELPIEGYDQACPLFTYTYTAPFLSNADYEWSITNGYIVSGQYDNEVVVTLSAHSSNQSILGVEITNHCTNSVYGQKIITHGDPPFPAEQCFTSNPPDKPINNKNNLGFDENDILIYPNPAETTTTILNLTKQSFGIIITDLSGRILEQFPESSEPQIQVNTVDYSDGIYFIKFIGKQRNITKKLIIKN